MNFVLKKNHCVTILARKCEKLKSFQHYFSSLSRTVSIFAHCQILISLPMFIDKGKCTIQSRKSKSKGLEVLFRSIKNSNYREVGIKIYNSRKDYYQFFSLSTSVSGMYKKRLNETKNI